MISIADDVHCGDWLAHGTYISSEYTRLFIYFCIQASSDPATAVNGGGTAASVPNLQIFINDFVCQANSQGVGYFFFEVRYSDWMRQFFSSHYFNTVH